MDFRQWPAPVVRHDHVDDLHGLRRFGWCCYFHERIPVDFRQLIDLVDPLHGDCTADADALGPFVLTFDQLEGSERGPLRQRDVAAIADFVDQLRLVLMRLEPPGYPPALDGTSQQTAILDC